jgi:hypothetical protein
MVGSSHRALDSSALWPLQSGDPLWASVAPGWAAACCACRPGIASTPPPYVPCSLSSGNAYGTWALFPHHPRILMWFYSPALLLSGCLWPSVSKLEMYKVKLRSIGRRFAPTMSWSGFSAKSNVVRIKWPPPFAMRRVVYCCSMPLSAVSSSTS